MSQTAPLAPEVAEVAPQCPGCPRRMPPGASYCCRPCAVSGDGQARHDQSCDARAAERAQLAGAAGLPQPGGGLFPEMAPRPVVIECPGRPTPQGSKKPHSNCGQDARECRRCHRRHVVNMHLSEDAGEHLVTWRKRVATAARQVMTGRAPLSGPLDVTLVFTIARPQNHYRSGRYAHLLTDSAPAWPDSDPDWDKLARAAGDALTGIAYADDCQIVHGSVWMTYDRDAPVQVPGALSVPGVSIVVTQIA